MKPGPCWSRICRARARLWGIAQDNRLFINAVFWILRTGAPWQDLPPDYGGWSKHAPPFHSLAR
ncbi:MAG: transposase [Candidatus Competibacter sp.]|nr:transposase [Candidatus Competibacter sp.]